MWASQRFWSWPKQLATDDHEGHAGPDERQDLVLAPLADVEAHLVVLVASERPERRPAWCPSPGRAQLPVGL